MAQNGLHRDEFVLSDNCFPPLPGAAATDSGQFDDNVEAGTSQINGGVISDGKNPESKLGENTSNKYPTEPDEESKEKGLNEEKKLIEQDTNDTDVTAHDLRPTDLNKVLKCPAFSVGEFQAVLVVLAAHPGNFIFQPIKYGEDLKKLRQQMKAYYEAGKALLPEVPVERVLKNKLFAARYVGDLWYRVVVTDSLMGSRVPVRLCDYGDAICVNISCLRELAPDFHNYPFMAVKGKLAGVMPVHKDWSPEDCIRFQTLVVDQILASIVVEINENNENPMEMVVTLYLVDTSKGEDQDIEIAEVLIQEQRAVKEG